MGVRGGADGLDARLQSVLTTGARGQLICNCKYPVAERLAVDMQGVA
nr:MAG TPA: hypothetical protein [Caudoviricetes sp.]